MAVEVIRWQEGHLSILDQTLLPGALVHRDLPDAQSVWEAITSLRVRGAPAIGVCAAYGVIVGVQERKPSSPEAFAAALAETCDFLATSRPTAVNLFWALDRMRAVPAEMGRAEATTESLLAALQAEAREIDRENVGLCQAIGRAGAGLITAGCGVITHCNAGALATCVAGTALAPLFQAKSEGRAFTVYADETRPLLQGARLTAWELMQAGIDVVLICDNTAAQVMREGRVQLAIVGADRIAANGDAANKIGTYGLAVLAKAHGIPFYVAAPYSTFDFTLESGDEIPIELRDSHEVTHGFGLQTAPDGVRVYSPAFDVTPSNLIAGFITERGILRPPYEASLTRLRECVTA
jgi:methylthioribose-1-phosphate isomerase